MPFRSIDTNGSLSRRNFIRTVGITGFLGLAGCSEQDGDGSGGDGNEGGDYGDVSGDDAVRVGFLHPLSGSFAGLGEAQQEGARVALDHVNNELGGIGGQEVGGSFEDTQGDPSTGREMARQLVESEDVDLLIGGVSGAVNVSISEYAYDAQVPYFAYGGSESITGEGCYPTTFRYQYSASQSAQAGAEWALENLGTNVWIHFAEYSFGQSIRDTWTDAMEASDIDHNIINVTSTPLDQNDYSSYISQIASSNADWVLQAFSGSPAINFLNQAEQFGMTEDTDIMSTTNAYQPIRQGAGSSAVGTYALIRYSHQYEDEAGANAEFVDAFTSEYDHPPTDFALVMWSSLRLYANAVEEAGTMELGDVVSALEGMESNEPMGPVTMRECDHQAVRDYAVGEIVEPQDNSWPALQIDEFRSGDSITEPCNETSCDIPPL